MVNESRRNLFKAVARRSSSTSLTRLLSNWWGEIITVSAGRVSDTFNRLSDVILLGTRLQVRNNNEKKQLAIHASRLLLEAGGNQSCRRNPFNYLTYGNSLFRYLTRYLTFLVKKYASGGIVPPTPLLIRALGQQCAALR